MILLSIVVPTKNRYQYLTYFLKQFIDIKEQNVELIIQDNSDDNRFILDELKNYEDNRIRYFHIFENLSVSDNCSEGIKNSRGKYVTLMGDDDCMTSEIMNIMDYINNNDIESVIFSKGSYKWPDTNVEKYKYRITEIKKPTLFIKKPKNKIRKLNARKELIKVLKAGGTNLGNLPQVYHGVCKRTVMDKVFEITGTFFPGSSPDMASSVSLALVVNSHVKIEMPFLFSGQGHKSGGGQAIRKEHKGELNNIDFLPKNILSNWNAKIPKVWTVTTIYADSIFNSLKYMNKANYMNYFNYLKSYCEFEDLNIEYKHMISGILDNKLSTKIRYKLVKVLFSIKKSIKYVKMYINRNLKIGNEVIKNNIPDSYEANKIVSDIIKKQGGLKNV